MKKFLTICIIAMTSAGIYGFIDMGREIHNGTMIQYEDLSAPTVKAYTRAKNQQQATANAISEKLAVIEANKKKLAEKEKLIINQANLKFEDFSRGEEIYLPANPNEVSLDEQSNTQDATSKTDSVKTTTPPTTSQFKKPETTPVAVVEETRAPVLEARYFSRGSPKMYKKSLAKK